MKTKLKKLLFSLILAVTVVFFASCEKADSALVTTTPDEQVSMAATLPTSTETPVSSSTAPIVSTQALTPSPTETATAVPSTKTPSSTPTPSGPPSFTNLRFASSPEATPRRAFGYGTEEVYALWEYSNMTENVVVQRRWDMAGEEIIREEPWDIEKYGTSGMVSDVFIFDYENEGGLVPGFYSLDLFIDGERVIFAPFNINGSWSVTDETTGRRAFVEDNTILIIEENNGQQRQIAEGMEIRELLWVPDGRYLLFSEWDRTEQVWQTSMGLEVTMWLIDVETGEKINLGNDYHSFRIGGNGQYSSVYVGSDFWDACGFDRELRFLQLGAGEIVAEFILFDFAGFPMDENDNFVPKNGFWQDENVYVTEIEALCDYDTGSNSHAAANEGIFAFNLATMTAERVGDLPEE